MSAGLMLLSLVVAVNVIGGVSLSVYSALAAVQAWRALRKPRAPQLRLVPVRY